MSRRILLHVGTPKTGTSSLQEVLFRCRDQLAARDVLYPADRFDAHFLAALDLMNLPWGGLEAEAVGRWERLARAVREHPGTAVVSHEILAHATRAQAERALADLGLARGGGGGGGGGAEVHVVLSVRDLVRQVPAEWQETVKHRGTVSYADFLAQLRHPSRDGRFASWFWSVQDLPDVLDRWARDLPPEQVHLVTVPPPGSPPGTLWERFSAVFELDGLDLPGDLARANPSLGAAETALVRRVNQAANTVVEPRHYRPLVRELLAHQTLSRRTRTPRLALPPDDRAWAVELGRTWAEELGRRGYRVAGDLADLVPAAATAPFADPDAPAESTVAEAGVEALTAVLVEAARLREREEHLARELAEAHRALERAYLRPTYRWREKTVRRLQRAGAGRRLLAAYRAVRGRSSRSA